MIEEIENLIRSNFDIISITIDVNKKGADQFHNELSKKVIGHTKEEQLENELINIVSRSRFTKFKTTGGVIVNINEID